MKYAVIVIAASMLTANLVSAAETPALLSDKSACSEGPVAQFGRYIGDWKITDEQLAQDGSAWGPGTGARWIFSCLGPGLGVQDFWMPNSGGFGSNLRIFNPDTESWEIVWTAAKLKGFSHITAKINEEGNIVMDVVKPAPNPPRRIIFFQPDETGWHWTMQMSFDEGETWTDVYRIVATPWEG